MLLSKNSVPSPYHFSCIFGKRPKKVRSKFIERVKHNRNKFLVKNHSVESKKEEKEDRILLELTEQFNSEENEFSLFLNDFNLSDIQIEGTSIDTSLTGDFSSDVVFLPRLLNKSNINKPQDEFLIQGKNILSSELDFCNSIPEDKRYIFINHILNDDGEGEPQLREEIIEKN